MSWYGNEEKNPWSVCGRDKWISLMKIKGKEDEQCEGVWVWKDCLEVRMCGKELNLWCMEVYFHEPYQEKAYIIRYRYTVQFKMWNDKFAYQALSLVTEMLYNKNYTIYHYSLLQKCMTQTLW